MTATIESPATTITHVFAGQLAKALALVVPATGTSNVLDWTRLVRLESKSDGTLHVAGTDMKWHVHTHAKTIGATGDWAAMVDSRKLKGLVDSFPAEAQVKLSLSKNRVTVECKRSNTTLPSGDPEVFPVLPDNSHSSIIANADEWAKGIAYTAWAAGSPSNPNHNAVQFKGEHVDGEPGAAMLSATDGNCAAVWHGLDADVVLSEGAVTEFRLPADTLRDAASVLRRAESLPVACRLMGGTAARPNMAVFAVPDPDDDPLAPARTVMAIRCLEGPIYDLRGTLDKVEQTPLEPDGGTFLADPEQMVASLRRVLIVGQSEKNGYVPVKLTIGGEMLHMQATGQQTGDGVDEFDITLETGRGNTVTLNADYMRGALEACHAAGGLASVRFTKRVSPAVFSPAGDDTLNILVMSMLPHGESDDESR